MHPLNIFIVLLIGSCFSTLISSVYLPFVVVHYTKYVPISYFVQKIVFFGGVLRKAVSVYTKLALSEFDL